MYTVLNPLVIRILQVQKSPALSPQYLDSYVNLLRAPLHEVLRAPLTPRYGVQIWYQMGVHVSLDLKWAGWGKGVGFSVARVQINYP
jgi:hypothetical protein